MKEAVVEFVVGLVWPMVLLAGHIFLGWVVVMAFVALYDHIQEGCEHNR